MLANENWKRRANISRKSFTVSIQLSCEGPNQVENDRAQRNRRKMPKRAPKCSYDGRGLFPELIAEVVQCSCVEHQRGRRDNQRQKDIQAKLPDSCLWDEQPHCKKPRQDRIQEELQQPQPATSQTASKN